jgi:hypothetical protein
MPCKNCTDPDGNPCFPSYGVAPHECFYKIPGAVIGQSALLPRDQWPDNFEEDPDCPGQGTYWCADCGHGKPSGSAAERQGAIASTESEERAPVHAPDSKWHDAVLAECMRIETGYHADDPVATLKALIDWHTRDVASTTGTPDSNAPESASTEQGDQGHLAKYRSAQAAARAAGKRVIALNEGSDALRKKIEELTPRGANPGGWRVRERRSAAGELLSCFVEAPAEGGMTYGLEVLGDDYNGFGDVERKLEHCKLIVSLVNAYAATGDEDIANPVFRKLLQKYGSAEFGHAKSVCLDEIHAFIRARDICLVASAIEKSQSTQLA